MRGGILSGLAAAGVAAAVAAPAALADAIPPYTTVMVSRQSDAAGGAPGDEDSIAAAVRARGRLVFFDSYATNFTPETADTDPSYRGWIFSRDVPRGVTRAETRNAKGELILGSFADASRDARYLALNRPRTYTREYDPIGGGYLRDRRTGALTLVTRATGVNGAPASDDANVNAVSDDGRYALFYTAAPNLAYGDVKTGWRLLLRDTHTGQTRRVTPARRHGPPYVAYWNGDISGDGRFVTWLESVDRSESDESRNTARIVVRDVRAGRSWTVDSWHGEDRFVALSEGEPRISADGRYVVYAGFARRHGRRTTSILRWDRRSGKRVVVSRGGDFSWSQFPSVSANGRFVAFAGVRWPPGHNGDRVDVWERDVARGRSYLVSRASGRHGARGDSFSRDGMVSPDGHYVAFSSNASNLTPEGRHSWRSVFLRHVIP